MKPLKIFVGTLIVIIGLVGSLYALGVVYFVPEYMNAVVTRFGEVQYAVLTGFDVSKKGADQQEVIKERYPGKISVGAGLYWKLPWETTHYFDSRILFWEGEVKQISTKDLRTLVIDSSARWRIKDVIKFYERLGQEQQARNRIGSVINSNIEDYLSETLLIEAVRNENLELETRVKKRIKSLGDEAEVESAKIRYGRKELIKKIEKEAAKELRERFGLELVDVMLTQLNYTDKVQQRVYQRMSSERKRIAERYRAQGEKTRKEILGNVQRQKDQMISNAERQVQEILGAAESRSIKIWARAYQKDPDFFRFQRSLKAYENSFDTQVQFLLTDDNRLLEFTTSDNP
ncbi:MAG: protease modulator HflC [bacterium]